MQIWYYCGNCRSTFDSYKETTWCPVCNCHGFTWRIEHNTGEK